MTHTPVSTQEILKALETLRVRYNEQLIDIALRYDPNAATPVNEMNHKDREEFTYIENRLNEATNLHRSLTRKELK